MQRRPNPFWRYSLARYRDPAVAAACLALQDRWGADVNVLLYCCWIGQRGRALNKRALRAVDTAVRTLQIEVIRPLRQARRTLRQPPDGVPRAWARQLKNRIAAVELDLEYIEHRMLLTATKQLPMTKRRWTARAAIDRNLTGYLTLLGVPATHADRRRATTLLSACVALGGTE